jgi:hypothetical protein
MAALCAASPTPEITYPEWIRPLARVFWRKVAGVSTAVDMGRGY